MKKILLGVFVVAGLLNAAHDAHAELKMLATYGPNKTFSSGSDTVKIIFPNIKTVMDLKITASLYNSGPHDLTLSSFATNGLIGEIAVTQLCDYTSVTEVYVTGRCKIDGKSTPVFGGISTTVFGGRPAPVFDGKSTTVIGWYDHSKWTCSAGVYSGPESISYSIGVSGHPTFRGLRNLDN